MADQVLYLNRTHASPMFSRLMKSIEDSKQGKATPPLWASMIRAMTQKGVKSMEIEESTILYWLETQDSNATILREDLLKKLNSLMFTVKEVRLGTPKYPGHRQSGGKYGEFLYVANSERDNTVDDLERVEYEMQELVFSPERLVDEPELVINLERERAALIELKGKAIDFSDHHFSGDITGRHGKNLLAHCRITEREDQGLYFIEEIQSDWAQKGRKCNWNGIPKGPLVTNTEAWAGMVLRRQLQLAACNPRVKNIAWITESMRNGGGQDTHGEQEKVQQKKVYDDALKEGIVQALAKIESDRMSPEALADAKQICKASVVSQLARQGISEPYDMLNDFYLKVIPKIIEKIIAGTGEKVEIKTFALSAENVVKVPSITLTDAVRKKLIEKQPVYSRALLLDVPRAENDPVLLGLVRNAAKMLGTPKSLRLVTHLYDVSTGAKVAGRYINKFTQVSLSAKDIVETCNHECFHFAQDNLFDQRELRILRESFALGTDLNEKVREILTKRGDFALAQDCLNPDESAAQGFALWKKGTLEVKEAPVRGIFSDLVAVIKEVGHWIRKEVLLQDFQTTGEIFEAFASGAIATRQDPHAAEQGKYQTMT